MGGVNGSEDVTWVLAHDLTMAGNEDQSPDKTRTGSSVLVWRARDPKLEEQIQYVFVEKIN